MYNIQHTKDRLKSFTEFPVGWEHDDSQPGNLRHYTMLIDVLDDVKSWQLNGMIYHDGSLGLFFYNDKDYVTIEIVDYKFELFYYDIVTKNHIFEEGLSHRELLDSLHRLWYNTHTGRIDCPDTNL